jgi:hypothetical protein
MVLPVLYAGYKIITAIDAAVDLGEKLEKKEWTTQETIQSVANVVLISTTFWDLGIPVLKEIGPASITSYLTENSTKVAVAVTGVAAVADISRTISRKMIEGKLSRRDIPSIACVVFFRVGTMTSSYGAALRSLTENRIVMYDPEALAELIKNLGLCDSSLFQIGAAVYLRSDESKKHIRAVLEFCKKMRRHPPAANKPTAKTGAEPVKPAVELAPQIAVTVEESEESLEEIYESMMDLGKLKKIPKRFHEDFLWICPITKEPIRFIVEPAVVGGGDAWYEKEALENFLAKKPNELPPNWPQGVAFKKENIRSCHQIQTSINLLLKKIQDGIKAELDG